MAPRPSISRAELLRRLGAPNVRLPLPFGWPHHQVAVCCEAGVWRLRVLVTDEPRFDALRQERLSKRQPFMPEHGETCLIPGPKILLEAESLDEFIRKLEAGPWPPW